MKISHLLLAALGMVAVHSAATADNIAAAPAADGDKKVCRRVETTGSIMPNKRVCRKKSEWAEVDRVNRDNTERAIANKPRSGNQPQ